jgi:alpha-L-fucosidase
MWCGMKYEATYRSLRRHPVPAWFHDAKLGIFVHWGLYSVPGWAPLTGELTDVVAKEGWAGWYTRNPYAEWYLNTIRIPESPSHQYHVATYGADFSYDDFAPRFNEAIQKWDPEEWADLFQKVGARYVVLTTKHHDGFLLWPSRHPNPKKERYLAARDLVGELTEAVRARGLRMGLYYSGGLDWTFNDLVIRHGLDMFAGVPQGADYVAYADGHWVELIDRYQPSILWNDIGYPAAANLRQLFADYYNRVPDGVINDRFIQLKAGGDWLFKNRLVRSVTSWLVGQMMARGLFSLPAGKHYDYRTPEYSSFKTITDLKWEATRGIAYSFGYNRNEGPEHTLSVRELVHSFVDIVSKNGNLLLNVGPMADGTIPLLQRERLLGLGRWLAVNGEAVFDTRPWVKAEGRTDRGAAVRFTQREGAVYAILLDTPRHRQVTIESLDAGADATVHLLGYGPALNWKQDGVNLAITLPSVLPDGVPGSPAYAFRITPPPRIRGR